MKQISVLIVDDSAIVRQVVSELLSKDPTFKVIGTAADPIFAMKKMEKQWPDVIILDVEMPRMDGITFLKKIMAEHPTPVVICSTLTDPHSETMQRVISSGAVEIVTKPKVGLKGFLTDSAQQLINAVKGASKVKLTKRNTQALNVTNKVTVDSFLPAGNHMGTMSTTEKIVAIGASTGGTQALETLITALPRSCPGIVIVQHMPENFTRAFAQRLDNLSQVKVKEASDNDRVLGGQVLIAPGGKHTIVKRSGAQFIVNVKDGPLVNRHRPSVDVLFRSVAKCAGRNALGIIMTGMGDDGVKGMKDMYESGAITIAQDERTCIVYGMPKEAVKAGIIDYIIPLDQIERMIHHYSFNKLKQVKRET